MRRAALDVRLAGAAACFAALLTSPRVAAHEPFQITTDGRAQRDGLTLHITMASRTATLACPGVVGAARSLRAEDFAEQRAALTACAQGLYVVSNAGVVLTPNAAAVALTVEDDFDARVRYPAPAPGALTFDAVFLARIPDAMFGAELTLTDERTFLGQALLRATARALTVNLPEPAPSAAPNAGARRETPLSDPVPGETRAWKLWVAAALLLLLGAAGLAYSRRR